MYVNIELSQTKQYDHILKRDYLAMSLCINMYFPGKRSRYNLNMVTYLQKWLINILEDLNKKKKKNSLSSEVLLNSVAPVKIFLTFSFL